MDNEQVNQEIEDVTSDPVDRLLQDKKPSSSGKSIAVLALLVALASVSATGWQWWQTRLADPEDNTQQEALTRLQESQQQLADSVASFEDKLNAVEPSVDVAELSRRNQRLLNAEGQLSEIQGQVGQDQASIDAMRANLRSLEQRLSATESGLINVAASSMNSSATLDIAEIDFLLRAANERLSLFADPAAADLALRAADLQIEALNDPMFLSVRQRIATARQALAALPDVDRVQLSARLAGMQSRIPELPFRGEAAIQLEPEAVLAEDAGWWESFKHTMSSLVTVRRRVADDQSLLSLEDKDYLRQGLWLQLESARLALMRNDAEAYNGSLERVNRTVEQFFNSGSSQARELLSESTAMGQIDIAPVMPDISEPWTQLRQLRDARRLLQSATPVEVAPVNNAPVENPPIEDVPKEGEAVEVSKDDSEESGA